MLTPSPPLQLTLGGTVWVEGQGEAAFERGTLISQPSADVISVEPPPHVESALGAATTTPGRLRGSAWLLYVSRLWPLVTLGTHPAVANWVSLTIRLEGSGRVIEAQADKVSLETFGERLLLLMSRCIPSTDALGLPPDTLPPVPPLIEHSDSFGMRIEETQAQLGLRPTFPCPL